MPFAEINGVRLNYETAGKGRDIVFIHGFIADLEDWRAQIEAFSRSYRVLALDMRGRGKSGATAQEEDYSLDRLCDDVFGWLKHAGVSRCCLAGHSVGGYIALRTALDHPELVASLVIADSWAGRFAPSDEALAFKEKADEVALRQGTRAAFKYDLENNPGTKARYQKHPETLEGMRAKTAGTSPEAYVYAWRQMLRNEPVSGRLGEIKVPTLVVCGEDDAAFLPTSRAVRDGIQGAGLAIIKGAGHGPQYEKPEAFNRELAGFLKRTGW